VWLNGLYKIKTGLWILITGISWCLQQLKAKSPLPKVEAGKDNSCQKKKTRDYPTCLAGPSKTSCIVQSALHSHPRNIWAIWRSSQYLHISNISAKWRCCQYISANINKRKTNPIEHKTRTKPKPKWAEKSEQQWWSQAFWETTLNRTSLH
jgi:tRNA G18 (ribose-2'-O)-methylase SpoU